MYGETLKDYVDILAGKFRSGEISKERFLRLTDKLIAWEIAARQRGLM